MWLQITYKGKEYLKKNVREFDSCLVGHFYNRKLKVSIIYYNNTGERIYADFIQASDLKSYHEDDKYI